LKVAEFVPWDSRPLDEWTRTHAPGYVVTIDGRQTHFVKRGSGPAVVLLHGFNMDLNTWIANIDVLARHFTVYALDLWGFGYSTRGPLDWGYDLYSTQIAGFLDHLELGRAHLVGHSMGGGVAVAFAANHPERVDRLVLVGSVGEPRPPTNRERLFRLPWLPEMLLALPTDTVRRRNLLDFWIHDPELLTEGTFHTLTRFQKIEGSTRAALEILRRDFFNSLDREVDGLAVLGHPAMLVWGRFDRAVPVDIGWALHGRIPGSRFEVLDRSSHLPNFDEPDRFNDLVVTFLVD
jgi:pimeloyl-ACP methyl ester carboxylesterase